MVDLVAFKRTAEIVRDYVRKGSKVYVEGKLRHAVGKRRPEALHNGIFINELVLLDGGGKREEPQNNEVEVNDRICLFDLSNRGHPFGTDLFRRQ